MQQKLIIGFVAILIGLVVGYLLFGGAVSPLTDETKPAEVQENNHSAHDHSSMSEQEEIWTCSMHPQIRRNEPGDCPICGMDLIPASGSSNNDPTVLEMTEASVALANIQTSVVGQVVSTDGSALRFSGKVQADERQASSQVAHLPGRIERLYVSFTGEQVVAGQKVVDIYSPELITAQRELLEALQLQAVNPNLVEAARNKLRYWKITEEAIADIEALGKIQEIFTLYADATGIVTDRKVAVGDYVGRGEVLFSLLNLQKVWVLFDAFEADLPAVSIGDQVSFSSPALPGKTFTTRVSFIDPVLNPLTRTASLRTEVNNPGGRLKPEMLVYGKLQPQPEGEAALTVPKTAVLWTGKRSVVYVKLPDAPVPSFQFREVELGEARGNAYELLAGLEAGEEVVTYGNFAIDAAAQLNNQASMMNRNVRVKGRITETVVPSFVAETPQAFQVQLEQLLMAYLSIKDALVATDSEVTSTAIPGFLTALQQVDMSLIQGDAHLYWMEQNNAMQAHAEAMANAEEIEVQRRQFSFLSTALIHSLQAFGLKGQTAYVQHCPMALDNEGADWLALEETINNPYFGDAMLRCGLVEAIIE